MIWGKLLRPAQAEKLDTSVDSPAGWFLNWMLGNQSTSGINVTEDSAMRTAAVYACVRVLAETLAQLPVHVYERRTNGTKRLASEHPLNSILSFVPNQWQTSFEFLEMMMGHLVLRGNAFAQIVPGINGAVTQLIPWHPGRVRVERLDNGRLRYILMQPAGGEIPFAQDEVFHIRGLSSDGIMGLSPIQLVRDPIGLSKAAETYGAKLFSNRAMPGGLLTSDTNMDAQQREQNKKSWQDAQAGVENMHKVAVLSGGLKWQQVGMSNADTQFIEMRKLQVVEIARAFRVPAHLINDLERATFSNIEQQSMEFVTFTMMPWLARWEAAIRRDLISEPDRYYVRFNVDGLLRGDSAARSAFYREMVNSGIYSINDARELEDMDPIPDGDEHLVNGTMITLDRAINPPAPVAPAPPAPKPDEVKDAEDKAEQAEENAKVEQQRRIEAETLAAIESAKRAAAESECDAANRRRMQAEAERLDAEHREKAISEEAARSNEARDEAARRAAELQQQADAECECKTKLAAELAAAQEREAELSRQHAEADSEKALLAGNLESERAASADLAARCEAAAAQNREKLLETFDRMARYEADGVRQATKKPNFLNAVEDFYEHHGERMRASLSAPILIHGSLSGTQRDPETIVATWLAASHAGVVELAGKCNADTLGETVEEYVSNWQQRAQNYALEIVGEKA